MALTHDDAEGVRDVDFDALPSWQAAAMEAMDQGVLVLGTAGALLHANTAARRLLRMPGGAPEGWRTDDELRTYDRDGVEIPPMARPGGVALAEGRRASALMELRWPDGSSRWVEVAATPTTYHGQPAAVSTFVDVTAREVAMAAERAGTERAAFAAAMLNSMDDAVVLYDTDLRIVWINEYGAEQLRVDPVAAIGRNAWDVIDLGEAAALLRGHIDDALAGRPVELVWEARLEHRLGTTWRLRFFPVRDNDGRVIGVAQVARDITADRALEEQARVDAARLRAILEGTSAVVYAKDLDGRFTLVNREFEELFGLGRDELLGRTDADVVGAELAEDLRANDRRVLESGMPITYTEHVPRHGRDTTWVSVKVPMRDEGGEVIGVAGISTDITEAMQTAEQLGRLGAVVEAADDAVATYDRTLVVTSWNRAAERLTGRPAAAALGKHVADVDWPFDADRHALLAEVRTVLAGDRREREVVHAGAGGDRVLVELHYPIHDPSGDVTGGAIVARDVTAQRAAERERLDLQREVDHLQRLESLGALAGGVAHDFNNLLAAINLTTEILARSLPAGGPQREQAEQILAISQRGVALTQQMLVFARREQGLAEVVDLDEAVQRADSLLERSLGEQVRRRVELGAGPKPVRADPVLLEQVLINLAINARDAMPDGGTLHVATSRTTLAAGDLDRFGGAAEPGEYVVLAVSDDGPGMDAETLEHATEPFFTTKPVGSGTGLGLSLVFGFASKAGGGMVIYSEPGQGTSVRVYLPVAEVTGRRASEAEAPARGGSGECVLVVEDAPELRGLVRRLLETSGYTVLAYPDGASALAAEHDEAPELLLTDVVMPGLSGPQLATALRERHPGLRVLLVSGYNRQPDDTDEAASYPLVEKPFTADALLRAVREVLDG